MKVRLVRIGNSQGVRIPRAIITQCGLESEVEMTVRDGAVVIAPVKALRQGWEEGFRRMAEAGDDAPLLPEGMANVWDETEWTW